MVLPRSGSRLTRSHAPPPSVFNGVPVRQHLVSRVLLRRWSNHRNGPVAKLDLITLDEKVDKVDDLGCVDDLVIVGAEHAERRWQEVEKRLPYAFQQLDDGQLLNDQKAVETVKECLALHYARALALAVMLNQVQDQAAGRVVDRLLGHVSANTALYAITGLIVPSGAEDPLREKVRQLFEAHLQLQGFLGRQFLEHFDRARAKTAPFQLEVVTAQDHEFVIGDIPVITYDRDADAVGVLNGAPWGNADAIFMALGPRHLVALANTARTTVATSDQVVQLNRLQIRGAVREVYFRPGSGLGKAIVEALRASI